MSLVVVHGGAVGVDQAFEDAAEEFGLGITTEPHPADWEGPHGLSAGPMRNGAMVAAGADFCLAVHKSLAWSKGTANCVKLALAAGIEVYLIASDDDPGRRIRAVPSKEGVRR